MHRHTHHLRHFPTQPLHVLAFLANDDAGPAGVNGYSRGLGGTLDLDSADRRLRQSLLYEVPHDQIVMQLVGIVRPICIPDRRMILDDSQSKSDGVYFLTHNGLPL